MSPITVVTSCSASGWEQYGRRFVETFQQHWPAEIGLHLVSEDALDASIPVLNLFEISPAAKAFDERHHHNARAHGREFIPERIKKLKRKDPDYNFRFDAYRFAKKVFAIEAVARQTEGGRLFWVDADVETFAPVPVEMLERLLPDTVALSCLDRGTQYHSECGFVGYNLDHPQSRPFIEAFADLYASDKVFDLGEWHDSWVFDWLRREMKIQTHAIPHNSRHHPFVNSEDLGSVMDHKKGRRKAMGKTPTHEVLSSKRRALPYWSRAQ